MSKFEMSFYTYYNKLKYIMHFFMIIISRVRSVLLVIQPFIMRFKFFYYKSPIMCLNYVIQLKKNVIVLFYSTFKT